MYPVQLLSGAERTFGDDKRERAANIHIRQKMLHHAARPDWRRHAIGIGKEDDFSGGVIHSLRYRARLSPCVGILGLRADDINAPRMLPGHLLHDGVGAVLRLIIHHDDLYATGRVILPQQRAQALLDILLLIPRGHQDGDGWVLRRDSVFQPVHASHRHTEERILQSIACAGDNEEDIDHKEAANLRRWPPIREGTRLVRHVYEQIIRFGPPGYDSFQRRIIKFLSMLTLRSSQLDSLGDNSRDRFITDAMAILSRHWPAEAARRQESLRVDVEQNVSRAMQYGWLEEKEILRYLNVAFALGSNFADDTRYPWATRLLADDTIHPKMKLEILVQKTSDLLNNMEVD